ncbi:LANO_0C00496g1_1 [Lachancea nothofagi CBS 11611]|uniref:LANO_0C00496g1_1 n=1 Tax=Lachancea nothofagi CBS 11611 TaxID=1266666 RepID=A0A1G4J3M9_9SACH|nr:LANO_0C00496g1_1 [Lachancea nothofagi CBS 11611]
MLSPQYNTTTQRYALASQARTKLLSCAAQSKNTELNLRVLVGHANLLDRVMGTLQEPNAAGDDNESDEDVEESQIAEYESDDEEGQFDDDSDSDNDYVIEPQHVTFSLPAPPRATVYEYNSDSEEDDGENDSDSDSDFYNDSASEPEENYATVKLHRPSHYTLTRDGDMAKPSNGNLLLVSIPEENDDELDVDHHGTPRQLSGETAA